MALISPIMVGAGLFFIISPETLTDALDADNVELKIMGIVYGAIGLLMLIGYLIPFFVPRKPWVWIYNLVLICLGITSCLTLPFCIAMLIFWLKPHPKLWYGKTLTPQELMPIHQ